MKKVVEISQIRDIKREFYIADNNNTVSCNTRSSDLCLVLLFGGGTAFCADNSNLALFTKGQQKFPVLYNLQEDNDSCSVCSYNSFDRSVDNSNRFDMTDKLPKKLQLLEASYDNDEEAYKCYNSTVLLPYLVSVEVDKFV